MKKRRQFFLGIAAGVALALILLIMTKVAGKL
jgi:hypothetical protein